MNFTTLANKGIITLNPYIPGKPIEELERELGIKNIIKLASNENPLGPSPKAIIAAKKATETVNLYPDSNGYELLHGLAEKLNLDPTQLVLGNGSDDILHCIGNVFIQPSEAVMMSQYAFVSYNIIALKYGGKPIAVPVNNWHYDLEAMTKAISAQTKLIYLANPNNPTGTWFNHNQLEKFLQQLPNNIIVVLDEAYYEYMQHLPRYPDSLKLQQRFNNLIITRTFSKVYGLAGLRIGYGIAHPEIIALINKACLPFNVSTVAQKAAIAALNDQQHVHKSIELNAQGRTFLLQHLSELGIENIADGGNFITVDIKHMKQNAENIFQALLKQGIIVRPLTNYDMPHHLRITIGLPEQNQQLITALHNVLKL